VWGGGPRSSSAISAWNFEEPEPNRSSKVAELVDRKRGEEPEVERIKSVRQSMAKTALVRCQVILELGAGMNLEE